MLFSATFWAANQIHIALTTFTDMPERFPTMDVSIDTECRFQHCFSLACGSGESGLEFP
jgi:hypothetical protein